MAFKEAVLGGLCVVLSVGLAMSLWIPQGYPPSAYGQQGPYAQRGPFAAPQPYVQKIGYRGDICGRTLAQYRKWGVPGIPQSPELPPNTTGPPLTNEQRAIEMLRNEFHEPIDLPDLNPAFLSPANNLAALLNPSAEALMDCACEFAHDCMPEIGSRARSPQYAHQCYGNMECCCST